LRIDKFVLRVSGMMDIWQLTTIDRLAPWHFLKVARSFATALKPVVVVRVSIWRTIEGVALVTAVA
jgi:hypothetical protein